MGAKILAFPKHRRFKSRKVLEAYHAARPNCEVCGQPAMPTPHHLVHPGGSDRYDEILSLCFSHHVGSQGWHGSMGKHRWYEKFKSHLSRQARTKIEAVLNVKR